jgi:hypothetical protein
LEIIEIQAAWGQPFRDTGQCRPGAADIQRRAQVGLQHREMVEYEILKDVPAGNLADQLGNFLKDPPAADRLMIIVSS